METSSESAFAGVVYAHSSSSSGVFDGDANYTSYPRSKYFGKLSSEERLAGDTWKQMDALALLGDVKTHPAVRIPTRYSRYTRNTN